MEHAYPELILRATPPRVHKMVLQRERLSSFSMDIGDKALVVVKAPPGYGKTSLLVQWRKEWISKGEVVAWLTLDERDDSVRFIRSLAVAMDIATGNTRFERSVEQWVAEKNDGFAALANWLAEVANIGRETVLIIDDYHYFSEKIGHVTIEYLIRNAPSNLRIVIAARDTALLDFGDLVPFNQFSMLENHTLRFFREESIALLAVWSNGRMDLADAEYLHELTGGWPLGLQLVMSSIGKSSNLKDAVAKVSATTGNIERYFVDFLIDRLAPEESDFLIRISALDAVCPSLCAAVISNQQADNLLQMLRKSTPIFIEVSEPWLRMHPLVKEFLYSRWQLLPPEERADFHANAACWLSSAKMYEEAAYHAMQADQNEQAYSLIEQCLYDITARGQFGRVMSWIDKLPGEEVQRRPKLRLAAAWALAMSKRHPEAEMLVRKILSESYVAESDQCECAAILAAAAYYADRIDDSYMIISPWFDAVLMNQGEMSAIILGQKSLFYLYRGEPEIARYFLSKASSGQSKQSFYAVKGFYVWVTGLTYLWEGQVIMGEKYLRENFLIAEREVGRNSAIATSLAVGLAFSLFELGKLAEARAVLMSYRLEHIESHCSPDVILMAYRTTAKLYVDAGDDAQAHDVLRELCVIGEMGKSPRLLLIGLAERIRLHALKSQAFTCVALSEKLDAIARPTSQVKSGLFRELLSLQILIAHAYVAMAKQNWRLMIEILDQTLPLLDHLHRGRERVQIMFMHALATLQIGGDGEASLSEAFSLAEMYGLRQLSKEFMPLLGAWGRRYEASVQGTVVPAVPDKNEEKKDAGSGKGMTGHKSSVAQTSMLTPREYQILSLLSRHMTNKEIGNAINIGEETVKWHLKNIYGKLHAGTRKHVIVRARIMGILE